MILSPPDGAGLTAAVQFPQRPRPRSAITQLPEPDLRAGTVKARRPRVGAGGAKRRALHGAEHRSSIDCVMVGGSVPDALVAMERTPKRTTIAPRAHAAIGCTIGRGTSALVIRISRKIRDQIVPTKWTTIGATFLRR